MDMAYSELPDDVEIVENAQGRFEPRSAERDVRIGVPKTTPEAARVACLTYLNVRAAMDRVGAAVRGTSAYPPTHYTREQYERACDELGLIRLPDSVCQSLGDVRFEPPEHDAETIIIGSLAQRRRSGLLAEERRQRRDFEKDLVRLPGFYSHGLTREQYEKTCMWIGADPAPERRITALKAACYEQEEVGDMVDLPLILAKWRATGKYKERRGRAP
ncbi:hypothetical protein NE236_20965 [Actinoallomurus purpureus]|uniref:hypothetical protein n=1 Tax=Actinoallomurus purpureus TaxID=478114 RepID=UPI002092EA65|nr:hypothetical protein [Actinoallomurus purpureus]MCO6007453.1 hypothetical protein [Actinoallomurus purpureus]